MPEKTFLKLIEKRQEEILMIAFEEFALNDFKSASLSAIIKKIGLAKGSFYRYFSGKKNLYAYLLKVATERRLSKLDLLIEKDANDFFNLLEDNFMNKIKFDLEYPVIGGFLYRVMLEKNNSEIKDIIENLFSEILSTIKDIVNNKYFKEQIGTFDPDLLAHNILYMQFGLYEYISRKYKIDFTLNIKQNKPVLNLSETELKEIISQQVQILKTGIKKQSI